MSMFHESSVCPFLLPIRVSVIQSLDTEREAESIMKRFEVTSWSPGDQPQEEEEESEQEEENDEEGDIKMVEEEETELSDHSSFESKSSKSSKNIKMRRQNRGPRMPISQWDTRKVMLFLSRVDKKHAIKSTKSDHIQTFKRMDGRKLASLDLDDFEKIVADQKWAQIYFEETKKKVKEEDGRQRGNNSRKISNICADEITKHSETIVPSMNNYSESIATSMTNHSDTIASSSTKNTIDIAPSFTSAYNQNYLIQYLDGEQIIFVDPEIVSNVSHAPSRNDSEESDFEKVEDSEESDLDDPPIMPSGAFCDYTELGPMSFDLAGDTVSFSSTNQLTSSFIGLVESPEFQPLPEHLVDDNNNNHHNYIHIEDDNHLRHDHIHHRDLIHHHDHIDHIEDDDVDDDVEDDESSLPNLELLLPQTVPVHPRVKPSSDHTDALSSESPIHFSASSKTTSLNSSDAKSLPQYILFPPPPQLVKGTNHDFSNGNVNGNLNNDVLLLPKQEQRQKQHCSTSPPPNCPSSTTPPNEKSEKNHRGRSRTARPLWKFMLDLLVDEEHNPATVTWVDKDSMIFKVTNTKVLGALWGEEKKNPTMDFDKLSRAIRFYYGKNVFQPVTNKRLNYKFGESVRSSVRQWLVKSAF